jgi:GAF domain-containing protein
VATAGHCTCSCSFSDLLALALAAPVAVTPLVAAPWLSLPVAGLEAVVLYARSLTSDYTPEPIGLIVLGALSLIAWVSSSSLENTLKESQRNASALADSNRELEASRALLEAHARELERRSVQLEASAAVGHAATTILEIDRLIQQAVELIREQFDLYYVGLFLIDETGQRAVLRAGTGEAGQAMLARGHRISVGEGMIGWSIAYGQARVALDAGEEAVRLATAELPDTRSEAALPLRSRGHVLGALTVQSDQPAAFDEETVVVLQTMADQVAVAIDNARLFAETQASLEAARRAYGQLSRAGWADLLRAHLALSYRCDARGVTQAGESWRPDMERALHTGETIQGNGTTTEERTTLAVPVKVRGTVIGVLDTYKPTTAGAWTPAEIALTEALADQVGLALEGARLYGDAQRRAARERLAAQVTTRMRETLDLEAVLKTAVREIGQTLDLHDVTIRLEADADQAGQNPVPSGEEAE